MCQPLRSVRCVRFLPLLMVLCLGLAAATPGRAADHPPGAELVLLGSDSSEGADPSLLGPASAFELRFSLPMIPEAEVGQTAAESPLIITPAWPGIFRWTSQRGGVFTPSAPPPLGAAYQVALRPGLLSADGQPIAAPIAQIFKTPALEVHGTVVWPGTSPDARALPGPRLELVFNAAVDPAKIAPALSFQNPAGGPPVAAVVTAATGKDDFTFGPLKPQRTWQELFRAAHATLSAGPPAVAAPADNRVFVRPATPLPPSRETWQLVAAAGLTGNDPGATLRAAVVMPVAKVAPMELTKVEAVNDGRKARKLVVHFSKKLARGLTDDSIALWLHVNPEVENMQFAIQSPENSYQSEGQVEISGPFATGINYAVTADAGLPSMNHAYELAADTTATVRFAVEPPQIAFPDFSIQQLAVGQREFAFSARNAARVRVRAKLVPPEQAPQALIAYDEVNYGHSRFDYGYTSGHRLNFDQVPGEVIFDREIAGSRETDDPATVDLRWNDILGAHPNGVVLLEAEQPEPTPGETKRAGAQTLVQITDLGAIWKTSPGGKLLAYVFSMADAAPMAAARVRLLDAAGHALSADPGAGELTSPDGVAQFAAGADKARWLEVIAGADCHVLPFASSRRNSLGLYSFHLPQNAYPQEDGTAADDEDENGAVTSPQKAAPKPPRREVMLFSERGVYRPGEQAHVKAIVRAWDAGGPGGLVDIPAGTRATLRAFDAKGRRFWQENMPLSAAGSLAATIPLPTAAPGHYRVQIYFEGATTSAEADAPDTDTAGNGDEENDDDDDSDAATPNVCRFLVQDYQPNAFEVKLARPIAPPVGAGRVPLALTARYYMGKALAYASALWSLKADDTVFMPAGFDDYVFGDIDFDSELNRKPGELALDGRGALSAQGELTLAPDIVLNTVSPGPRRVHLQASVTDEDQQTVAANEAFTVHSSNFYLGVRAMPEIVRAGDPLPLEVVAVQAADAQPRTGPVPVTAKLSRIAWRTNRVANDSGNSDYDSHAQLIPISTVELTTTGVRRVGGQWEPAAEAAPPAEWEGSPSGPAKGAPARLVPAEPGEYVVEFSSQDEAGRPVGTATTFQALGDKEAEWGYRNAWQLPLVADKTEYHAGEEATLLVKTPISGQALVTVERAGVLRSFVTRIAREHPAVHMPILPGDAPDVYISVLLLRGSEQSPRRIKQPEYRAGYCQLIVSKSDTKLSVDVRPQKAEYEPGEDVAVDVAVTDENRQPAAGAEVTLYAVDNGVLSLTGYRLPDALKAFYHPRPLEVQTGLSLPDLFSEDPDDLNFSGEKGYASNKGYLVGGGGENGRAERLRQNFVACAYWNAALVTDAQGRVSAHFPAPDGLTEYQIMAVVQEGGQGGADVAAAGRFGGGQSSFRINKPLMLEPAPPLFGNVGDHVQLRAIVHNQSGVAGEAAVTLDLDDKASLDPAAAAAPTRQVWLAAGEEKAVDFPIIFTRAGEAAWTWHARLTGAGTPAPTWQDAVRSTLPVDDPVPLRVEIASARTENDRADDILAGVDPEVLEGRDGVIQVSVSTTRLTDLADGIDALLHYPYGCVEQTTSSLLPWLALRDFRDVFPELRHTPEQVNDAVARGVDRLLGMQTESGGLAYWPQVTGRSPSPWGSAYGGLGLALAKQAGYYVPDAAFKKLCDYLSAGLRSDRKDTRDTYHEHNETDRCLALYALALAGRPEPAYCEKYFERRDELSPEERTLLALAIAPDKGSADMVRTLLSPGPRENEAPETWSAFASGAVVDGMRLAAWSEFQPQDPIVQERLTRLFDDRTSAGTWATTQGNAWALLGTASYARNVEKTRTVASGTVTLGGVSQAFALNDALGSFTCQFPLTAAANGQEKLSLTTTDGSRLYVRARVSSHPRAGLALLAAPTNGKGGYVIQRHYEKILDDGTRAAADNLQVGDRVLITLEIDSPERAAYVAVNDPLPAVFEAVNPDFKTAGAGGNAPAPRGFDWWFSDFRELRTDRAVFFCDQLLSGRFRLQYLARVRAAGSAIAPPARIEEMYRPDHYAETAAATVVSKALE